MNRLEHLRQLADRLPPEPGVYIFKNRQGRFLYIGKAKSLRARVKSYFTGHDKRPMIPHLLREAADLDCITTQTPLEAMILEAQLIRRHLPRYNTLLRDTRGHPYVRLTLDERYPRVEIVFRTRKDGSAYFGPFRSIGHARKVLDFVFRLFRIRQCNLPLDGERQFPVCLLYHIGRCSGPCAGHITPDDYRRDVEAAQELLSGQTGRVIAELRRRMEDFARNMAFEAAALYRDAVRTLETWDARPAVLDHQGRSVDILGWAERDGTVAWTVFQIRKGYLMQRREFVVRADDLDAATPDEWWEQTLAQFYLTVKDPPDEIWLPVRLRRKRTLVEWLRYHFHRNIRVRNPGDLRDQDTRMLKWARENAQAVLETYGTVSEPDDMAALRQLQQVLDLPTYPFRIEGFDISNIQGQWNVGAMVVFEGGRPLKAHYRRFRVRTVTGPDDYACLREVVFRRYQGRLKKQLPDPDLILIDGGRGQLNAALEALEAAGLSHLPTVALAKREEEVFRPDVPQPLHLPMHSPALKLLQRVRDEAHRWAIRYYRSLHRAARSSWTLTEVPGIGPRRAWELLKHFGSWDNLKQAGKKELAQVVGHVVAENLYKWLQSTKNQVSEKEIKEEYKEFQSF